VLLFHSSSRDVQEDGCTWSKAFLATSTSSSSLVILFEEFTRKERPKKQSR